MNQYGTVEPSSDYETSDTGTSSLNNSLSEEEFTLECSNIDSGGLKLMISFRKRSCDDEVDNSSGTNLNISANNDLAEDKNTDMEKQADYYTISSDMDSQEMSSDQLRDVLDSDKSHYDLSLTVLDSGDMLCSPASTSPLNVLNPTVSTASTSYDKDKALLTAVSCENITFHEETPFLDVINISEALKPLKRVKQMGSINSCVNDIHDPLLRLDTLPNVSPDSGIISLDESPIGNDSPSSLLNGEIIMEHGSLTSCGIVAEHMQNMVDTVTPAHLSHEVVKLTNSQGLLNCSLHLPTEFEENDIVMTEDSVSYSQYISERTIADTHQTTERFSPQNKNFTKDGKYGESINSCLKAPSHFPLSTNGNSVIISSPRKISQAMGRKKRGRPPKKKNSILFKHKKSTLYSGLYGSQIISELKDTVVSCGNNKGSIIDSTDTSHAKQTCQTSAALVSRKTENELVTKNNCDNLVAKKELLEGRRDHCRNKS